MKDLELIEKYMDTRYSFLGFKVGYDGIIGLIPGVGDFVTTLPALYVVLRSAQLGAPKIILVRMIGNIVLESAIGIIPFLGDLFDFIWKSNSKNLKLLRNYMEDPRRTTRNSTSGVILVAVAALAILGFILYGIFKLFEQLI